MFGAVLGAIRDVLQAPLADGGVFGCYTAAPLLQPDKSTLASDLL